MRIPLAVLRSSITGSGISQTGSSVLSNNISRWASNKSKDHIIRSVYASLDDLAHSHTTPHPILNYPDLMFIEKNDAEYRLCKIMLPSFLANDICHKRR